VGPPLSAGGGVGISANKQCVGQTIRRITAALSERKFEDIVKQLQ
jgi:hypothetical protein